MTTHTATISSPILASILRDTKIDGVHSLHTFIHIPRGMFNLYGGTDGTWIGYKFRQHGKLLPPNVGTFTADGMYVNSKDSTEVVFSIEANHATPDLTKRTLRLTDSYGNTEISDVALEDNHYVARFVQPNIVTNVKNSIALPYSFDLLLSETQIISDLKTMLEAYIEYVQAGKAEDKAGWINGQIMLYTYHVKLLRLTNYAFDIMMEYTLQRFTEEPDVFNEERLYTHNYLLLTTQRNITQFDNWLKLGLLPWDIGLRKRALRRTNLGSIISTFVDTYDAHQIKGWLDRYSR